MGNIIAHLLFEKIIFMCLFFNMGHVRCPSATLKRIIEILNLQVFHAMKIVLKVPQNFRIIG